MRLRVSMWTWCGWPLQDRVRLQEDGVSVGCGACVWLGLLDLLQWVWAGEGPVQHAATHQGAAQGTLWWVQIASVTLSSYYSLSVLCANTKYCIYSMVRSANVTLATIQSVSVSVVKTTTVPWRIVTQLAWLYYSAHCDPLCSFIHSEWVLLALHYNTLQFKTVCSVPPQGKCEPLLHYPHRA